MLFLAMSITAMTSRREWLHKSIAVAMSALFLLYIALLFSRLGSGQGRGAAGKIRQLFALLRCARRLDLEVVEVVGATCACARARACAG